MKIYIVFVLIIISGCCYPNHKLSRLEKLTFYNKRQCNKTRMVQEFIQPEDTSNVLKKLDYNKILFNAEQNTVLNILYYVEQLKYKNDKTDYWQYPIETIEKGGDCEDKTFLLLSMLIQGGIKDVYGIKGNFLGKGHMWVEYKNYILDPIRKLHKLIPVKKSTGYKPYFKFDQNNVYYCEVGKE